MYKKVRLELLSVEFPFLANAADTVTVMSDDTYMNEAFTLGRGAEITVLSEGMNVGSVYFVVERRNVKYRVWNEDREKLNFVRAIPIESLAKRESPFDAIVTEDIEAETEGRTISIPQGARVTVKGSGSEVLVSCYYFNCG